VVQEGIAATVGRGSSESEWESATGGGIRLFWFDRVFAAPLDLLIFMLPALTVPHQWAT